MDTKAVRPASPFVESPSTTRQALQFSIGQRVLATVMATSPKDHLLHLEIAGKAVRAQSLLRVSVGDTLQLEVVRGGGVPTLKVLAPTVGNPIGDALKLYLPKQQDFSILTGQLLRAVQPEVKSHTVPESLKGAAQSLLQKLPDLASLSNPTGLASAIRRSGIFFEAQMAAQSGIIADSDLKGSLLRFLSALYKTAGNSTLPGNPDHTSEPPNSGDNASRADCNDETLLQTTAKKQENPIPEQMPDDIAVDNRLIDTLKKTGEGALAKLVLDQLASLPKHQPGEQQWQLTLPFIHEQQAHSVALTISRESENPGPADAHEKWSVVLELHPPGLGTVRCHLAIRAGSVDTRFRCEREATATRLADNLETLRLRYQEAGLEPGHLESTVGLLQNCGPRLSADRLLDERA